MKIDQEMCNRYNQLTNVLSTISFFQLQSLAVKIEAAAASAAAAYKEDLARFEQNLVSMAGGMQELDSHLQEYRQELQGMWPKLQAMGVQLEQLNQLVHKVDGVAGAVEEVDRKLEELMTYIRQGKQQEQHGADQQQWGKVLLPRPDMLVPLDHVRVMPGCLGEGGYGAVFPAIYGSEEVAVKKFFMQGATDEELKKVSQSPVIVCIVSCWELAKLDCMFWHNIIIISASTLKTTVLCSTSLFQKQFKRPTSLFVMAYQKMY